MLRCRRKSQRDRLVPAITLSWARTDSLPRGRDAGFQFKNVGPLVGCPPSLWIYFVSAQGASAATAKLLFEKVCDNMTSYSLLSSTAGCLQPEFASKNAWDVFEAGDFRRYDLVVACDVDTKLQLESLAEGDDWSRRICCLSDFLDVCEAEVQATQLLGPPERAGDRTFEALKAVERIRQLPDDSHDAMAEAAMKLAVAGLERFLIALFPTELKDSLHPYLFPKGIL